MTPRAIIKGFLPGQQHLAELIIERLQENGYSIVPNEATPEIINAGNWTNRQRGALIYRNLIAAADAGVR